MKKTKNLKIDVNFDITDSHIMRNSKYPSNKSPQSISTPTSVKNFSSKIPLLQPNTTHNDTRTPKNKIIFEERKQNSLKTTLRYKSNFFKENNEKPLFRETNKLLNYTPLTVQNKMISDKTRKSFDTYNKPNLMESVKKEILTSRNTKMPSIYNPISITSLLNYQHLPLDTNSIKTEYKNYEKSKSSTKANNLIKSYAANTYQGILRY
jgi:hypothetical protein